MRYTSTGSRPGVRLTRHLDGLPEYLPDLEMLDRPRESPCSPVKLSFRDSFLVEVALA